MKPETTATCGHLTEVDEICLKADRLDAVVTECEESIELSEKIVEALVLNEQKDRAAGIAFFAKMILKIAKGETDG